MYKEEGFVLSLKAVTVEEEAIIVGLCCACGCGASLDKVISAESLYKAMCLVFVFTPELEEKMDKFSMTYLYFVCLLISNKKWISSISSLPHTKKRHVLPLFSCFFFFFFIVLTPIILYMYKFYPLTS